MATAGYSGTPLPQKLGIKEGHKVVLVGSPTGFALQPLPTGARVGKRLTGNAYDVLVVFVTKRAELIAQLASCRPKMTQAGGLWIAWPKRASGVPTDIVEDTIREVALPTGLVDNKVCAIDETWSGLRLVIRKELRAKPAATKPAATKPAATKPAATKPAATRPAATRPASPRGRAPSRAPRRASAR